MTISAAHTHMLGSAELCFRVETKQKVHVHAASVLPMASCQEQSDCSANTDISSNQCLLSPTDFVTSLSLGHDLMVRMQWRPKIFIQARFCKTFLYKFYSKAYFKPILRITEYTSPVFSGMENYFGCFSRGKKGA